MSSCRGILIAGVTNQARTQMAEGFLRAFTHNALFICSGGLQHAGRVHPFALRAMANVGIPIDQQSSTSLEGPRRQRNTYDVYISIDEPYIDRRGDHYQQRSVNYSYDNALHISNDSDDQCNVSLSASPLSSLTAYADPLLAAPMPQHWTVGLDTTDSRQSWTLWSPRDPSIFHETSTRKFQDHLYEGEPLFMRVRPSELRRACRVQHRWEVPSLVVRYAMETEAEQFGRFVRARDQLAPRCVELIRELEKVYGESLLDAGSVAAYTEAVTADAGAGGLKSMYNESEIRSLPSPAKESVREKTPSFL